MAYLRKIARSPFWYLRYRDVETGRWLEENLKLRVDDPKQTLKARKEATTRTSEEQAGPPNHRENFSAWVTDYTRFHYLNQNSAFRYQKVWKTLAAFLGEQRIHHPREIKYEHAFEYMAWRKGQGIAHNTARLEVKHLSFLMSEAIRREYAERNPIALARIELAASKEKQELTDEQIQKARAAFAARKDAPWMGTIFEILIHLGCRFHEARIHRSKIDFTGKSILIEDSKRPETDPRKWFTAPLPDQLAAILKEATYYKGFTAPEPTSTSNRDFNLVLRKGARFASSHCCRVSFISRCHRAGLSELQTMRLVNHSTRMVHRIYSRLNVADVRNARELVPLPPPPVTKKTEPSGASSSDRKKDTP
jgi:hypothetical protein